MALGHRRVGVIVHGRLLDLTPSPALPLLGGGSEHAPATITASRTRTAAATGYSARASTGTAGRICLPGFCTECSGDGALKQQTREWKR